MRFWSCHCSSSVLKKRWPALSLCIRSGVGLGNALVWTYDKWCHLSVAMYKKECHLSFVVYKEQCHLSISMYKKQWQVLLLALFGIWFLNDSFGIWDACFRLLQLCFELCNSFLNRKLNQKSKIKKKWACMNSYIFSRILIDVGL